MAMSKWHVNLETGEVSFCTRPLGECPHASRYEHFYSETEAYERSAHKVKQIRDWISYSRIPSRGGYSTVHIFYPGEKYNYSHSFLHIKPGHQIIMEPAPGSRNYFAYELDGDKKTWRALRVDPGDLFEISGRPDLEEKLSELAARKEVLDSWSMTHQMGGARNLRMILRRIGGRLEVPANGAEPFDIDWYDEDYMTMEQWKKFKKRD